MTEGVIVIEAAPDTRPARELLSLKATATGARGTDRAHGVSARGDLSSRRRPWAFPGPDPALAVTDPSDITVERDARRDRAQAGSIRVALDVTVTRNPRYEQGVNLAVVLEHLGGIHGNPLPPGVKLKESGSKTLLGPKETKGKVDHRGRRELHLHVKRSRSPSWVTSRSTSSSRPRIAADPSW